MQTHLAHMQLNVQASNIGFYQDLLTFLGWKVIAGGADQGWLGIGDSKGVSLWFLSDLKDVPYDYDGPGLNHIGIGVAAQTDVDAAASYIAERGIAYLFETPRHRPDFSGDGPNTYYQVMFESPDRLLFEIVYTGPKAA